MKTKFWRTPAVILAATVVSCGGREPGVIYVYLEAGAGGSGANGGENDSGGSGGGAGGLGGGAGKGGKSDSGVKDAASDYIPPKPTEFQVYLAVSSGGVGVSTVPVSVRKGQDPWQSWGTVGEYDQKPWWVDIAEPGFDGAGIKVDPPAGYLSAPRQLAKTEFVMDPDAPFNMVIARVPVAYDLTIGSWGCEKQEQKSGVPTGQKWSTSGTIGMEPKVEENSSYYFASGSALDIGFKLAGKHISLEDASWSAGGKVEDGVKAFSLTAYSKKTPQLEYFYVCKQP